MVVFQSQTEPKIIQDFERRKNRVDLFNKSCLPPQQAPSCVYNTPTTSSLSTAPASQALSGRLPRRDETAVFSGETMVVFGLRLEPEGVPIEWFGRRQKRFGLWVFQPGLPGLTTENEQNKCLGA